MIYHTCTFCNKKGVKFISIEEGLGKALKDHGFPYSLSDFETLSYKTYQCNNCISADRDRLYKIYIDKFLPKDKKLKILEFAPAEPIRKWLSKRKKTDYRTADLYMDNVDDRVDIMNMKIYKDQAFDFFICSHILEHVKDDKKALRELYRILKNDGSGIIMAPIITRPGAHDEDPRIKDIPTRWRRFAQDDHIRIYDQKTFKNRLTSAGFEVQEITYKQLGRVNFIRNGIDLKSKLYVVKKKDKS
jgi:predicted SAM-dependent methyltransferase